MQCVTNHSWVNLFTPSGELSSPTVTQTFRVLRKHGEPLLMLPTNAALAVQALSLYPAQSSLARVARFALRQTLRCGLPLAGVRAEVVVAFSAKVPEILLRLVSAEKLPSIAMLAGTA